jgi:hypothetical protein
MLKKRKIRGEASGVSSTIQSGIFYLRSEIWLEGLTFHFLLFPTVVLLEISVGKSDNQDFHSVQAQFLIFFQCMREILT